MAGFGYAYLKDAPTDDHSIGLYAAGGLIGLVFAFLTYASTAMWADRKTGSIMTRCGLVFVAVWLIAMVARIGFVWAVSDVPAFRDWVGTHMMSMHLTSDAIAPFFVIWALTMVVGRVVGLAARSRAVRAQFDSSSESWSSPSSSTDRPSLGRSETRRAQPSSSPRSARSEQCSSSSTTMSASSTSAC